MTRKIAWGFLGLVIVATITVWLVIFSEISAGQLKVYFLDVGQGDAIFIETPNGNQVLLDAGRNKQVLRALRQAMPFYDRSIDLIIASHPDLDHIGGLPLVLERFAVGGYVETGSNNDSSAYRALLARVAKEDLTPIIARRGMRLVLDQAVYLDILFPDRDVSGLKTNESSIVAMLTYGQTKFLLTADSPKKIEEYLTYLDRAGLTAQVLKVGHHGSHTSTSNLFLEAVKPTLAIIQAGQNNSYGHPHQEVVDLLLNEGAEILDNRLLGTIKLTSDGQTVLIAD